MLRFGEVELDLDTREVVLAGEAQHLQPQAFDLLAYLVRQRDRVVPKAELLDVVWGDQFVSESALTTRIKEIRKATGDDGRAQAVIKNHRARGYRFVAELADAEVDAEADVGASIAPPPPHDRGQRHVPPRPPTPSVSLDGEIERLAELTEARRLITIVGPGGVGKTRLALEVGRAVADRHALGTRVVELSRISEAAAIGPTIRRALDRSEVGSSLTTGLGAIDALVVLDNCEHLIDAVAEEVPGLVAGGDALRVLATSREPLGLPGEQRWALAPLSTIGPASPAITLFVERALDVGVAVDPEDPLALAIVSCLDGIPLALEMAAARLATMGLADVANELEQSVAALRAGPRGVPERHTTLRAVLAWSEALLTDELRTVLADVSIFAGPVEAVDLPAAVDVSDAVGAVCALAERSLVTVDTTHRATARYGSLETVRQVSRERLLAEGRFDVVGRRHATWFTHAAEEAATTYESVDQADAVARIDALLDEFRAAHLWARNHDPALAVRLSLALYQPAYQQLRLEVFDWSLALVDAIDPSDERAAQLWGETALGLTLLGQIDEGRDLAERAISASSDPMRCRAAYGAMADVHLYNGDLEQSLAFAVRQDDLVERGGGRIERAVSKASLALSLAYQGRHDEALRLVPTEPPAGAPPVAWAWLAYARGEVLLDRDPPTALAELDSAIALAESVDSHFLSGVAQVSAASLRARTGQAEDAIVPLAETIERLLDRGNATHLLTTLRNIPSLLVRLEEWGAAAEVLGWLSTATISPTYGDEARRLAAAEQATRSALGPAAFAELADQGPQRSLDETARFTAALLRGARSPADR